jgi:hypothetical protein
MQIAQLPYLDEHAMDIATDIEEVWPVLIEAVDTTCCADRCPVVSTGFLLLARARPRHRDPALPQGDQASIGIATPAIRLMG